MFSMQETDTALLEGLCITKQERDISSPWESWCQYRCDSGMETNIRYSIIQEGSWDDQTELKFETTRAFVQRKEKGRGKRDCSPDSFSLFRNKEVAQKSCICHFRDARDSVFCNCCFDLCLPDHKQAPYQSHSKVKKWSRGLDMWASAFIMSKTSASMQSSQRLRAFALGK